MPIVSELKKLHKVMTGADATGDRISEVIESLAENTESEDSNLETILELTLGEIITEGDIPPGFNVWNGELTTEQNEAWLAAMGQNTRYFNSDSYPLTNLAIPSMDVWAYNIDWSSELPEIVYDELPAYGVIIAIEEGHGDALWTVVSKEGEDLTGQTVRILAEPAE